MNIFRKLFVSTLALTLGGSVAWAASTNFDQTWDYSMSASGIWEGSAVTWEKATNWKNDSTGVNFSSGAAIPQYTANTLGSTLIDGDQFIVEPQMSSGYKVATAPTLNGSNFKLGVANKVQLTINKIGTAISNMNLFVDETSKLIIGSFDGQLTPSGTNNLHVDSENGLRVNGNLLSGTYQVYLGEKGSISIGGRINGATKTKFADVKLKVSTTGTKRVSSRTIVSYGNKTGDFTFSNSSASEVGGLSLTKKDSVTIADAVGSYAFSQSTTAVTIQWVEGAEGGADDPAPTPTVNGNRVINFNFRCNSAPTGEIPNVDQKTLVGMMPQRSWNKNTDTLTNGSLNSLNVWDIDNSSLEAKDVSITWGQSLNACGKYRNYDHFSNAQEYMYLHTFMTFRSGQMATTSMTISNINAAFEKYDVYLYFNGEHDTSYGQDKYNYITINGIDCSVDENGALVPKSQSQWGATRQTTAALGVNVVKIPNLTGDTFTYAMTAESCSVAAFQIVEKVDAADELVFENTDCTAIDVMGMGNYKPVSMLIPALSDLPAGTKLRIKSVTFAAQVNTTYPTGSSAEFITINGVQSDSRTGLTSATDDWSIGKEMTFAFSKDAIITVGELATMGTVQGNGARDTLRIRLFKTTDEKYSYITLDDSTDQWRAAYKIVAERENGQKVIAISFNAMAKKISQYGGVNSNGSEANRLTDGEDAGIPNLAIPGKAWLQVEDKSSASAVNAYVYDVYNGVVSTTSKANVTWNSANVWAWTDATAKILRGYLDDSDSGNVVSVSDIPFAKYDVIFIAATDDTKNLSFGAPEVNEVQYTYSNGEVIEGTANWGEAQTKTIAYGTNAMRITGLSGDLSVKGMKGTGSRGCIAAIVIVESDEEEPPPREPATIYWKGGDGTINSNTTFEDGEGNDVKYISGDEIVIDGDCKVTLALSVETLRVKNGAVLQIGSAGNVTTKLYLDEGGVFDANGVNDKTYPIVLNGGTLANYGKAIGSGLMQYWNLEVAANSFIDAQSDFGTIASGHGAQTLKLGGNTLTKLGAGNFYIANATFTGSGTIDIEEGSVVLMKGTKLPNDLTVKIGPNGETITAGTGFAINSGKIIFDISEALKTASNEITLLDAKATVSVEKFDLTGLPDDPKQNWQIQIDGTLVKAVNEYVLLRVDGIAYSSIKAAFKNVRANGASVEIIDTERLTFEDGILKEYGEAVDLTPYAVELSEGDEGEIIVNLAMAEGASLIITEVMPKSTDSINHGTLESYDINGLASGWVEVKNTSDKWVDLKDYRFIRVNRSKKLDTAGYGNFPSRLIAPHSLAIFYTSERYANSVDMTVSAFATPVDAEKPHIFTELNDVLVWPDKVNPKKFPFVRLYYAPNDKISEIVDTVVIPSDLPEGASIILEPVEEGKATVRYICEAPTRGRENPSTDNLEKLGPNVGPLYERADGKKHDSASEFDKPVSMAVAGEDYEITFALNPTMSPTEAAAFREEDKITGIKLVYRTDLNNDTLTEVEVDLGTKVNDANDLGDTYKASIPASAFPAAGHLIQWKFEITDASGNTWTSPSYHNKDDGYEWYGTIVEPTEAQKSATLTTWHMFADAASVKQMDVDADKQDRTIVPNQARVAIYDSSTQHYYDYVRIDLRGNTTAGFKKKSHGLRFAKAHPLTMTDIVTGGTVKEIRKSSLIAEYSDPSFLRQVLAFWLFDKNGSPAPFDFPVRCNLNGEFFELGFHSERFTDELIEDIHGLDKFGYGYKNVGSFGNGTSAGGIEKKTPDDEDETSAKAMAPLNAFFGLLPQNEVTSDADHEKYTKVVVENMDLPAWLNYIALSKITQEMDDVWANLSGYWDNPAMIEGVRGTGVWMPLAYDMNTSLGVWYKEVTFPQGGLMAAQDWFKSHPFYGGYKLPAYTNEARTGTIGRRNRAYEAIFQNEKFRRLYLRRLRTLMDAELGEPNQDETYETCEAPIIAKMRELIPLISADAVLDRKEWGYGTGTQIDVWGAANFPKTVEAGAEDLYANYFVPRREHLYVTHSIDAEKVGYDSTLAAGIPHKQSAIEDLKGGFSAEIVDGGVVIRNANEETIDLSGWKVSGPVAMTLPAGTVIDQKMGNKDGELFVVTDRRQYVADNTSTLTDEVIIGNAEAGDVANPIGLTSPDGINVFATEKGEQELYLRLWGFAGAPDGASTDENEFIIFTNLNQKAELDASDAHIQFEKYGAAPENRCNFVLPAETIIPAGGWVRFNQADVPWTKITDGAQEITLSAANGVVIENFSNLDQATIIGGKGSGNMAVHNLETDEWYALPITEAPGYEPPPAPPPVDLDWADTNVTEKITLAPGYTYNFANVNFEGGLELPAGEYTIKNDGSSSVNTAAFVLGAGASITFIGKGKFELNGKEITEPLFAAKDLYITKGTFAIDVTTATAKTAAVSLTGNFGLSGEGKLEMTLAGTQPVGIELTEKKMKADFEAGSFTAILGGTKPSAFKFKDSDEVTLSGGTMKVTIVGTGAKVLNGGTIVFKDEYTCNITGEETATDATVFEAGKTLTVNGGTFNISVPGEGSQILTTADDPEEKDLTLTINGGTFELLAGDDCVKSAGNDAVTDPESVNTKRNVVINGGNFYGVSLGNDVIDSNGDIIITGGNILAYTTAVEEDGNGSTGLDVNEGRKIEVTGGNVIAIGGPNSSFYYDGGVAYTTDSLVAEDFSEKFVELDGKGGATLTRIWTKLPKLTVDEISLFCFTAGIDPTILPKVSDETPPEEFATGFHDLYICEHYSPVPGYRYYYYTATKPNDDFPAEWADQLTDMPEDVVLVLSGEGENGFAYSKNGNVTFNNLHLVFESGTHSFTRINNNGGTQFASGATPENPTFLVKRGATLTITARDLSGWNCAVDTTGVIRVNDGGILNLNDNGSNTFYFNQQLYLDAGAQVNVKSADNRFRVNGGINEGTPQIYVASSECGVATINLQEGTSLTVAADRYPDAAIFVGEGSKLIINGDVASTGDGTRTLQKFGLGILEITGTCAPTLVQPLLAIDGSCCFTWEEALQRIKAVGSILTILDNSRLVYTSGKLMLDDKTIDLEAKKMILSDTDGVLKITPDIAGGALYISELCPKPGVDDPNGLESGWIEFVNSGTGWVDMGEYRLIRINRSKKTDISDKSNLPSRLLAPGERFVIYTSERYPESDAKTTAFVKGEHSKSEVKSYAANELFVGSREITVWPDKVNPKKFSVMRLYKMTSEEAGDIIDTVVVPSDLPEGKSVIVGFAEDGEATKRWIAEPTKGEANPSTERLVALGPNIGPLYEIKDGKKHDSASEFALPVAPADPNADYAITFAANPVMNPNGSLTPRDEDTFTKIEIVYRKDLDNTTLKTKAVDLATLNKDAKDWGNKYTTTIPKSDLPEPGHLIQWKFLLTDKAGNTWTSPSFHNSDDGYEWYGTIVEPGEGQSSSKLNTLHIFGTSDIVDRPGYGGGDVLMNKDYADSMGAGARVCIYDQRTQQYYDYVRIDLRGNTSGKFIKKSHGLRFAKTHPLQLEKTYIDPASGTEIDELRKTSFISEFADPTYMRQMLAFWLLNDAGSQSPFDYPVRLNMNGKFYQLAFHSERFSEDLIEKTYGLDQFGYGYKNIGTFAGSSTAGGIEKKTPDDGNEYDNVFLNAFCKKMADLGVNDVQNDVTGASTAGLDNVELTKYVVEKVNLSSWFNYLAATRITHENDDVWANISGYCDDPTMKDGDAKPGSTGTWIPLAYDMNLSFGQWMTDGDSGNKGIGLRADDDYFKSHPFYGGYRVRQWMKGHTSTRNSGNRAFEAIWQNSKFRRLYLRRLRTLMDKYLVKLHATMDEDDSPIMNKIREFRELLAEDSVTDRIVWGYPEYNNSSRAGQLYDWAPGAFPRSTTDGVLDIDEGIKDLWENYLQPRRKYLFEKHTAKGKELSEIGYATTKLAGIPEAQSAIVDLREGITAEFDAELGAVVIRNANAETIDLSGWELSGPVSMTIPAGTVIDQAMDGVPGEVYITADRRATIAAMTITDQVVVGNGKTGKSDAKLTLTAVDGTKVVFEPSPAYNFLRLHSFDGVTPMPEGDMDEWITLTNLSSEVELNLAGVSVNFIKQGDAESKCEFTLGDGVIIPADGAITLRQSEIGWNKITNNKIYITITDADGSKVQDLAVTQKDFKNYYGEGGPGGAYYLQATTFAQDSETFVEVAYPATEIDVKPGEPVEVEAESVEAAIEKVTLVVETPEVEGLTEETYKGYFKLDAIEVETGKKYMVEAVLNPKVVQPKIKVVPEEIVEPFVVDEDKVTVEVKALLGLYYSLVRGVDVGEIDEIRDTKLATEKKLKLEDSVKDNEIKPASAFYHIEVNATGPIE